MTEIAIYGKGGIGKSTVSANVSAALAVAGAKVLQIGCDPKHDSTKLLLAGAEQPTVLEYIRKVSPLDYREEDILFRGFGGVGCVEAGGPKPGVGCAGRGIITTFELLEQLNIRQQFDTVIYDVLGDVVCGGFAVPIRREYAKMIFLVTSGEYMALYAANNILRGIRNYDGGECRVAGIILNRRGLKDEDVRVRSFAEAVGLPIVADLPRSEEFALAEKRSQTFAEGFPESPIAEKFRALAGEILAGPRLYPARPLDDDRLAEVVLQTEKPQRLAARAPEEAAREISAADLSAVLDVSSPNRYLSKSLIFNEPLHGCAFNGACTMSIQLKDAVVLAHSPKSCAYLSYQTFNSYGRRALFERGALLPAAVTPNYACTDMGEAEMIFGGMELLRQKVREIQAGSPRAIVIVSSCPSGIIGDDVDAMRELGTAESPVLTIRADGNLAGDYMQGMLLAYKELASQLIDRDVQPQGDCVNIMFEKVIAKNTDANLAVIKRYLAALGIGVNCRFLCETDCDSLRDMLRAPLNVMAYDDHTCRVLRSFFEEEYGCRFLDQPFPVGFDATEQWIRDVAAFFGKSRQAEELLAAEKAAYQRGLEVLRPVLAGRKLMVAAYNNNLDWILRTAADLGMEIAKIGIMDYPTDAGFQTALAVRPDVEEGYTATRLEQDVDRLRPDVLLLNYTNAALADKVRVMDLIPMCPDVGFGAALTMAARWAQMLRLHIKGDWYDDERLFEQYYAG